MNVEDYFKEGKVNILKQDFAIIKAKQAQADAFANIIDEHERTVILSEDKIDEENVIEIEKGWRIFTIDVVFPFNLAGVISVISNKFAEKNVSIGLISAYSRGHFLIKKENIDKAVEIFKGLGLKVVKL